MIISGRIECLDMPRLRERVLASLQEGAGDVVVCDVAELVAPDAMAVDVLARLQLAARRLGGEIRLRGASDDLRDLLALTGLCDVLPECPG